MKIGVAVRAQGRICKGVSTDNVSDVDRSGPHRVWSIGIYTAASSTAISPARILIGIKRHVLQPSASGRFRWAR
jgi:hypothetical protein